MIKRLFDLVISIMLLIVTAPLLLIITLWLKLDSPGPALYTSQRVGKEGKPFGMLRFRTVDIHQPAHLDMSDRVTRIGRFIRNYSLDDLPNLINVVKGEMSIVGPRPTEPERVDQNDPVWQRILAVKPGVFSLAILKLAKKYNVSPLNLKKKVELEYVDNQSLLFEWKVLVKASKAFLVSKGNIKARGLPDPEIETSEEQTERRSCT